MKPHGIIGSLEACLLKDDGLQNYIKYVSSVFRPYQCSVFVFKNTIKNTSPVYFSVGHRCVLTCVVLDNQLYSFQLDLFEIQ